MKFIFSILLVVGGISFAYWNAQSKLTNSVNLSSVKLNMSLAEVEETFGRPFAQETNTLTYVLEDSSRLYLSFREDRVASAMVKYHTPIKIEDPKLRELTLIQMSINSASDENPSWFFAGKPEEGLIYKVTQRGEIESLTWVPPFSYGNHSPKHLGALLKDFKNQSSSNL
jgi:predicted ribosomally synthesized peptide with SipW-like signal peptide